MLMALRVVVFYLILSTSAVLWAVPMLLIGPFMPYRLRFKVILEWWCRMAIWLTRHLVGIHYEVTGMDNIPDQPGVILANQERAAVCALLRLGLCLAQADCHQPQQGAQLTATAQPHRRTAAA